MPRYRSELLLLCHQNAERPPRLHSWPFSHCFICFFWDVVPGCSSWMKVHQYASILDKIIMICRISHIWHYLTISDTLGASWCIVVNRGASWCIVVPDVTSQLVSVTEASSWAAAAVQKRCRRFVMFCPTPPTNTSSKVAARKPGNIRNFQFPSKSHSSSMSQFHVGSSPAKRSQEVAVSYIMYCNYVAVWTKSEPLRPCHTCAARPS